jgi:D-glycero-D-manno-heptose 1,7-bisphosphate phosphatase
VTIPARAVFLDRDNTLIDNDGDLGDPAHVRLLPGVAAALARLRDAGWRLVVVSNQGGVARGAFGEPDVEAVHDRIAQLVDAATGRRGVIDRFYYCPYHPDGAVERYRREHHWRKPQPGMLHAARDDLGLALEQSWLIGDQPRDVTAGKAAGCATILVSADEKAIAEAEPTAAVRSMAEAADVILKSRI